MAHEDIARNITAVRARMARACDRAGRDPGEVTLIAVTKTHPVESIVSAYEAGLRDFGENRVQEAQGKLPALRGKCPEATWHLIGNLQRNKVATAVDLFDVVHSVDSERLARAMNDRASQPARVYIEVNVSGEATKHGVEPDDVHTLAESMQRFPNLMLLGLMTVAPIVADPNEARPAFRRLRELRDVLGLAELSMGMTGDFEVAIEEGATSIRVGRAIFGARG